MICKAFDINRMDKTIYEKYFQLLSTTRRQRIEAMKTQEERVNAVACEMLARQCLSELTDAPEFAFSILTGINKVCVVSNFSAYFGLGRADSYLVCAADTVPVGIDCRRVEPFSFSEAAEIFNDVEIRHVFSRTVRSLADIVQQDVCALSDETEEYWKLYSLKEAYFNAYGRIFRDLKTIQFSFEENIPRCSDSRFSFGGSFRSEDGQYVYSVIRKTG